MSFFFRCYSGTFLSPSIKVSGHVCYVCELITLEFIKVFPIDTDIVPAYLKTVTEEGAMLRDIITFIISFSAFVCVHDFYCDYKVKCTQTYLGKIVIYDSHRLCDVGTFFEGIVGQLISDTPSV